MSHAPCHARGAILHEFNLILIPFAAVSSQELRDDNAQTVAVTAW
jgi:hypothetical protein